MKTHQHIFTVPKTSKKSLLIFFLINFHSTFHDMLFQENKAKCWKNFENLLLGLILPTNRSFECQNSVLCHTDYSCIYLLI